MKAITLAFRLALIWVAVLATDAQAQPNKLEVDVRPTVTDTSIMWDHSKPGKPGEGGHGKIYGIAKVDQIKTEYALVKPVDEGALVTIVLNELDKNGFREFKPGEKPDILLTVSYGRGGLHNPYFRGVGPIPADAGPSVLTPGPSGGAGGSDAPTVTLSGFMGFGQLMDQKGHGYEQKMQKAGYEKLFIRITAWSYPSGPKGKTKMLWKAIMAVDDPDHRDLNAVAAEMLAAGAPYFGKDIDKPEVEVFRPVPEGKVSVGTPEIVEPKSN